MSNGFYAELVSASLELSFRFLYVAPPRSPSDHGAFIICMLLFAINIPPLTWLILLFVLSGQNIYRKQNHKKIQSPACLLQAG